MFKVLASGPRGSEFSLFDGGCCNGGVGGDVAAVVLVVAAVAVVGMVDVLVLVMALLVRVVVSTRQLWIATV